MKYIFKLAFLNILRSKHRTILTCLILAVGIAMYIWSTALILGVDNESTRNTIDFETGHFKVRSSQFDEDKPFSLSNTIKNYKGIESILAGKKYVTGFAPRMNFMGELDNQKDSDMVMIVAIDPTKDSSVYTLTNYIMTNTKGERGALPHDGILIGYGLARDMGLKVGDPVYLSFRNYFGGNVSLAFNITGLVSSPSPTVNNGTVYIDLKMAADYIYSDGGEDSIDAETTKTKQPNETRVTEIAIKTADFQTSTRLYYKDLTEALKGYKVVTWEKINEVVATMIEAEGSASGIFVLFIIIIALVGIINTMLMSVYEKQKEIGMLKAMGMTDREVKLLFSFEGIIMGIFGGLLGLLLGFLLNLHGVLVGFDITEMMGDLDIGYKVSGIVRAEFAIEPYIIGFIVGVISSALASYYPAKKATDMQPVDALRIK